jgi:hypothetical protein
MIMSNNKQEMCPYFTDLTCPQGKDDADACSIRVNGYFDPILDIRDLHVLECARKQAQRKNMKADSDNTT